MHSKTARYTEPELSPQQEKLRVKYSTSTLRATSPFCQQHAHLLRSSEREFLDSLEDWVSELTDRQSDWLNGLHNQLRRRSRR